MERSQQLSIRTHSTVIERLEPPSCYNDALLEERECWRKPEIVSRRILDIASVKVGIELTNRCNMSCSMCPLNTLQRPKTDMSWELVEKVAAEFQLHGIQVRWLHEMGEPLLYPRLMEAINLFPGCSVSTNCKALGEETGRKILQTSLRRIRLCPDTINAEVYPVIRRGGNFDQTILNIRKFLELSKGHPIRVEIQKMVSKLTSDESMGDFQTFFRISDYPQAKVIEKTCEGLDTTDATELHEQYYGCFQGYPFRWFVVLADGRVTHCCYDSDGLQIIGDLKTQSIREILDGPRIPELMEAFRTKDWKKLPRCGECHRNTSTAAVAKDQLVRLGHKVEGLIPVKKLGRRLFNRSED